VHEVVFMPGKTALLLALAVVGCGPGSSTSTDAAAPDASGPDAPPGTIAVIGHALYLAGGPVGGASVQVMDINGPHPIVATDDSGGFAVPGVVRPYSLSVVPKPPRSTNGTAVTWEGVSRADPTVVIQGPIVPPPGANCPNGLRGTIKATLATPVGAGRAGSARFLSSDSSLDPAGVPTPSAGPIFAGSTTFDLPVDFDYAACRPSAVGKILYFEESATDVLAYALADVTVTAGQDVAVALTPAPVAAGTMTGTITFDRRPANGVVSLAVFAGTGRAAFPLAVDAVSVDALATSVSYTLPFPQASGLDYRVLASAEIMDASSWAWSDVRGAGGTVDLGLPPSAGGVSPRGPASSATPTFTSTPVAGATLYVTSVRDNTGLVWLGYSTSSSIALPSLPAPAALMTGNAVWESQAMRLAGGASVDQLLDGRLVRLWNGLGVITHPDVAISGSHQITPTAFTLP
jgi:hypothetical protein